MRFSSLTWTRRAFAGAAFALAALCAPTLASATPTGSVGISATAGGTADTGNILTATSVTVVAPILTGAGVGDLSGITLGSTATLSPTTYHVFALNSGTHSILPFTIAINTYTFTFTQEATVVQHLDPLTNTATLTLAFIGGIHDSSNVLPDDTASGLLSWTQTGGAGAAISFSGTLAHPSQVTVPEPASVALLGIGLLGIGFIRRRA